MRILLIGATGTIGSAIAAALRGRHDVIEASHKKAAITVDISDPESIRAMYKKAGKVDAVVSAAGAGKFAPLEKLSDDDFRFSLNNKLMGQVNLVRRGLGHVREGGSFTLTSGDLSQLPAPGSTAVTMTGAAVEGFARAAALDLEGRYRVNVVSPVWVAESRVRAGLPPMPGIWARDLADYYVRLVEGEATGQVVNVAAGT